MKSHFSKLVPFRLKELIKQLGVRRKLLNSQRCLSAVGVVDDAWRARINEVVSCPDNNAIPRASDAGRIEGPFITMHNGVQVCAMGYYGNGILNMLVENRGVHEPQEERAFEDILRHLPEDSVMLELGAYWGFYSLSLLRHCPNAICHLIEPCVKNLVSGKINFQRNGQCGRFKQAFVGSKESRTWSSIPTISVDAYCDRNHLKHLHVLHSDIQGAEYEMLLGAEQMLAKRMIDFLFISTHSNELHELCISILNKMQYKILAHANLDDTYSFDGLIVARSPTLSEPAELTISLKRHVSGRG